MPNSPFGKYTIIEKIYLICTTGSSNKFYDLELQDYGNGKFMACGFNGGIGQSATPRPQSETLVSEQEARRHFAAMEKKKRKEYWDDPNKQRFVAGATQQSQPAASTTTTTTPQPATEAAPVVPISSGASKTPTGINGHLPKPIDAERAKELLYDDDYDASQKFDGKKLYLTYRAGRIIATNKLGFEIAAPSMLADEFSSLARATGNDAGLTLDGEDFFGFRVYDLLEERGVSIKEYEYSRRMANMRLLAERYARYRAEQGMTGEPLIKFVDKAQITAEKLALAAHVEAEGGEGLVFAHKFETAQIYKYKRVRRLDVVAKTTGKRSIEGLVFHDGAFVSVGKINISEERMKRVREIVAQGEQPVCEVECLYASGLAEDGGKLQQAYVVHVREDKLPAQCTSDQMHACQTSKKVLNWREPLQRAA